VAVALTVPSGAGVELPLIDHSCRVRSSIVSLVLMDRPGVTGTSSPEACLVSVVGWRVADLSAIAGPLALVDGVLPRGF
jgi:hypothetical protein